ncbi:MAG: decarboxylating NADP(+)-dependent phosphogluconate dehydrogenase [Candidatus Izemoplasmataceae bacterium]
MLKEKSDIALIGIAVMGENLALNMESKGFQVTVSSRKQEVVDQFLSTRAKGKNIRGTTDLKTLVNDVSKPRKIMLMIKAGDPVDQVIEQLIPLLDKGDVIIDGGNSNYQDTTRRQKYLEEKGLLFVGTGVSGGEEGALIGPSIMPGGSPEAWPLIKVIFQSIAAKVENGEVCCDWVGKEGAGHYVKMVHNGIEYGDMQLISESYHVLKTLLDINADELGDIYEAWNKTELDSYLIEITADILKFKDESGEVVVDKILDAAGQKGTGKWTVNSSLDLGVPLTLIAESVYARIISSLKEERVQASKLFKATNVTLEKDKKTFIEDVRKALYAAKILSYTQGFVLMQEASKEYNWNLNYGNIALMWRGGCIIRSRFLSDIKAAFEVNANLKNLLLDPHFTKTMEACVQSLRNVVAKAVLNGIPTPGMSAAINYFDSYKANRLPANLLQAQRDYFGAHTYERTDKARGEFFHTNWTGRGGKTASTTYNV